MNETTSQHGSRLWSRVGRLHGRLGERRKVEDGGGSGRPRSDNLLGAVGLVGLTAVTSYVVATISLWLVPVYVASMILIFAAPRGPKSTGSSVYEDVEDELAPEPGSETSRRGNGSEGEASDSTSRDGESDASPVADPEAPAPLAEAAGASSKPRKRKGKGKKSKSSAAFDAASAPAQPTWIRVGPGKFVRADAQDPAPAADAAQTVSTEAGTDAELDSATDAPAPAPGCLTDPDAGEAGETGEPQADSPKREPGPVIVADATEPTDLASWTDRYDADFSPFVDPELHAEAHGNAPPTPGGGWESDDLAEEHGNAPSTFGEPEESVSNPDPDPFRDPEARLDDLATLDDGPNLDAEGGECSEASPESPARDRALHREGCAPVLATSIRRRPGRRTGPARPRTQRRLPRPRRNAAAPRPRPARTGRAGTTRAVARSARARGRDANALSSRHSRSPPGRC